MGSFKKLNKADITAVPYHANKTWSFSLQANQSGSEYVNYYGGQNTPYSPTGFSLNNQLYSLVYTSMNHMFYQSYTGSLDTGSLMFNIDTLESASIQRPTSSYFDYNNNPYLVKNYPTGANEIIRVFSVNQDIYGNKILPNSFIMSSSTAYVRDDGYGNLYSLTGTAISNYINLGYIAVSYFVSQSYPAGVNHIGNIFYAHGLIVITDQTAANYFNIPLNEQVSFSFQNEHTIYENEVRCIVKESDYNLTYNPTIITGSYSNGNIRNFATSSTFQPYATSIGLYNDDNDLLMVAKLAKPIVLSADTDMTFIVRYDT